MYLIDLQRFGLSKQCYFTPIIICRLEKIHAKKDKADFRDQLKSTGQNHPVSI